VPPDQERRPYNWGDHHDEAKEIARDNGANFPRVADSDRCKTATWERLSASALVAPCAARTLSSSLLLKQDASVLCVIRSAYVPSGRALEPGRGVIGTVNWEIGGEGRDHVGTIAFLRDPTNSLPLNQRVHGSSPCAPTIEINDLGAEIKQSK
jgi:hypothetical protein